MFIGEIEVRVSGWESFFFGMGLGKVNDSLCGNILRFLIFCFVFLWSKRLNLLGEEVINFVIFDV